MNTDFDVIVIGAGPAGENAAARAGRGGLRVAIVERQLVGGECSYWACMPSKALLRPGNALAAARRVPGAREAVGGEVHAPEALRFRDGMAAHWDDGGQTSWLDGAGVALVRGHGRLAGPRRVQVTRDDGAVETYEAARAVVIATGSEPSLPPVDGLEAVRTWDNRDATAAAEVPRGLLVLGGGPVGVEMAQAWRSLGCAAVTLVEIADRLLPGEEPFAGAELAAALRERGVDVRTGTAVESVRRPRDDGPVRARLGDGSEVTADELLVATGRRPRTRELGVETVGLRPGEPVEVDDRLRAVAVEGDWLYAVGDVNGRSPLTHTGKYQARAAGDVIAGRDARAWADRSAAPRVVFTDPQVAAVGATEAEARERGVDVETVRFDIGKVAGTSLHGEGISGTCQLVLDRDRRVVVGATFVGADVAELVHAATVAVVGGVTVDALWHAIPVFPTMSEVWLRLLETYGL